MVINDTTFLLDESLLALKKIHDIETLIESREWNGLNHEERRMKEGTLDEAKKGVRSWLILGKDTLDLFIYFTADAPEPFLEQVWFHVFLVCFRTPILMRVSLPSKGSVAR